MPNQSYNIQFRIQTAGGEQRIRNLQTAIRGIDATVLQTGGVVSGATQRAAAGFGGLRTAASTTRQTIGGLRVPVLGLTNNLRALGSQAQRTRTTIGGLRVPVLGLATSVRRANSGLTMMNQTLSSGLVLGRLWTGFFVGQQIVQAGAGIVRLADTFTDMQNRLRLVTDGTEQLGEVTDELFDIANRTRTAFDATATLYSRTALAAADLGIEQDRLLRFTESVNQAVILSGTAAQEARAGLIQLSQGIASNTLRGDELRSVLENLPLVADVIADSLGVTRGELRELAAEGRISAEVILDAFEEAAGRLEMQFAGTTATVSQSFTTLENAATRFIAAFDENQGTTNRLSQFFQGLADNIDRAARGLEYLNDQQLQRNRQEANEIANRAGFGNLPLGADISGGVIERLRRLDSTANGVNVFGLRTNQIEEARTQLDLLLLSLSGQGGFTPISQFRGPSARSILESNARGTLPLAPEPDARAAAAQSALAERLAQAVERGNRRALDASITTQRQLSTSRTGTLFANQFDFATQFGLASGQLDPRIRTEQLRRQLGSARGGLTDEDAGIRRQADSVANRVIDERTAEFSNTIDTNIINPLERGFNNFITGVESSLTDSLRSVGRAILQNITNQALANAGSGIADFAADNLGGLGIGDFFGIPGAQQGGEFRVRGRPGNDNNLGLVRLSRNETLQVRNQRQQSEERESTNREPTTIVYVGADTFRPLFASEREATVRQIELDNTTRGR